jgi:FkbM family methyltransferase
VTRAPTAPRPGAPPSARARVASRTKEALRQVVAGGARALLAATPFRLKVILREALELTERLDYGGHDLRLSISSRVEHAIRIHSCRREPETIEWLEREVRGGDVVYDVGANVGAYSLIAAVRGAGRARVYAFEPSFATFAALCRNVALNRLEESIVPLHLALADETTLGEFSLRDLRSGSSLHAYAGHAHPKVRGLPPLLRQPIVSYRIDDLVRVLPIPLPTLVKIDVDGAELAILRGAGQTLRDPRVRSLLVETEPESDQRDAITSFLGDRGFERWTGIRPGAPNTIFVRRSA